MSDYQQEGIAREIHLKEDLMIYVEQLLRFLYTGDYNDKLPDTHTLEVNGHLYALADKYGIKSLKQLARAKFEKCVARHTPHHIDLLPKVLEAVYTTTPASDRGLRDLLTPLLVRYKAELRADDHFVDLFKNRLDGDFALDVLDAFGGLKAPEGASNTPRNTSHWTNPVCPRCRTGTLYGWCAVNCGASRRLGLVAGSLRCSRCGSGTLTGFRCLVCQRSVTDEEFLIQT